MDVTLSISVYGRPVRTVRAIRSALEQQFNGELEILITGDGCPNWDIYLTVLKKDIKKSKHHVKLINLPHKGGFGYNVTNYNIFQATGKYFMFLDNDDVVEQSHVQNYYDQIKDKEYDCVYFDTWLDTEYKLRKSDLKEGSIGHSEVIVLTDLMRKLPPHLPYYGHDWWMVRDMMNMGCKFFKSTKKYTYRVMGTPAKREDINISDI